MKRHPAWLLRVNVAINKALAKTGRGEANSIISDTFWYLNGYIGPAVTQHLIRELL
jgi:hypothetical protein